MSLKYYVGHSQQIQHQHNEDYEYDQPYYSPNPASDY
jgi:hypothetical protein